MTKSLNDKMIILSRNDFVIGSTLIISGLIK